MEKNKMNLPDASKKFEQLVTRASKLLEFDFTSSLALASKFEQKFLKKAQDTGGAKQHLANVLTKAYRALTGRGTDQASADLATKTLFPIIESMPKLSDENALTQAKKMYQSLVRNQKTSVIAEELFTSIENLQNIINATSNATANVPAPPPANETGKQEEQKWIPIDPEIQRKLNKLLGTNLNPDGKLGPLTSGALERARKSLKLPEATTITEVAKAVDRRTV
jgi:hypothetical protein